MTTASAPAAPDSAAKARCTVFSALFAAAVLCSASAIAAPPGIPGAPTGTVSGDRVQLSWAAATDDEGVTGYNVYRDGAYLTTVQSNSASIALGPDNVTAVAVAAFDSPTDGTARGYSPLSQATEFRRAADTAPAEPSLPAPTPAPAPTPSGDPTAPANLVATRTSGSTVDLSCCLLYTSPSPRD